MADLYEPAMSVERAARAVCLSEGLDPDAVADDSNLPNWRRRVPLVCVMLDAVAKPPPASGPAEPTPDELRAGQAWYREWLEIGGAGARAMEPKLRRVERRRIRDAWRAWNGIIDAMLLSSAPPAGSAQRGWPEGDLGDDATAAAP